MAQRTDREMRLAPLPKRYSEAMPDGFATPVAPVTPGPSVPGKALSQAPMMDTYAETDGALLQAQIRAKLAARREMFGEQAGGAIKQRKQRPPKRVREAIRRKAAERAASREARDGVQGFAYERAPVVIRVERKPAPQPERRVAWDAEAFRRDIAEQRERAIRTGNTYADKLARRAAGK